MEKVRDARVEAELRIGQVLCAFGQGAGATRISRGVVGDIRERYLEIFEMRVEEDRAAGKDRWSVEGPNVLDRARAMGRLAAHIALCEGSMAVEARHLKSAREQIEAYHMGRYCPSDEERMPLPSPEKLRRRGDEAHGMH